MLVREEAAPAMSLCTPHPEKQTQLPQSGDHRGKAAPIDGRPVLDYGQSYLRSRLSVFPVRRDGSKAPDVDSWTPYQMELADEEQARDWWEQPCPPGVAICGGLVSGG